MLFSFLLRVVIFFVVSVNLPENPEEYALKHLNRSARFARCARSLAALADGMLFFLWRRVVSCGFGEAPKIIEKSTSKLPKSSPKPSQIHPKTDQDPPKNALKTRSGGDCASDRFCVSFFLGSGGVLGAFARLWGPTWSRLGASGSVLEPSWHGLWAVLGRPWCVLGRLGTSWGRLGRVSGHLGSVPGEIPRKTSIFDRFLLPTSTSDT